MASLSLPKVTTALILAGFKPYSRVSSPSGAFSATNLLALRLFSAPRAFITRPASAFLPACSGGKTIFQGSSFLSRLTSKVLPAREIESFVTFSLRSIDSLNLGTNVSKYANGLSFNLSNKISGTLPYVVSLSAMRLNTTRPFSRLPKRTFTFGSSGFNEGFTSFLISFFSSLALSSFLASSFFSSFGSSFLGVLSMPSM